MRKNNKAIILGVDLGFKYAGISISDDRAKIAYVKYLLKENNW